MHVLSHRSQGESQVSEDLLTVTAVCKTYGAVRALRQASISVAPGEVLGICGHNGAGKSTLVKILTGVVEPDEGEMRIAGEPVAFTGSQDAQRAGIAHVDQELTIVSTLSVRDNLELGDVRTPWLRRRLDTERVKGLLSTVGLEDIDPRRSAGSLSLGERQLLEIARGLSRNCTVLVLDEPTATLTRVEIARVFRAVRGLRATGAAVIFISHRLDEVMELCDRVTVMRDGAVVGTHAIGDLDRGRLVELILGEQGSDVAPDRPVRLAGEEHVLVVDSLTTPQTVAPVSLSARRGQIIGLAGQVGSGNTDVLRALGGLDPAARGVVVVNGRGVRLGSPHSSARSGIAYVSGDRKKSGLYLTRPIAENLVATRMSRIATAGVLGSRRLKKHARRLSERVGVDVRRLVAPAQDLSGGNQQKVLIGRGLDLERTNVMLLDEPTRGVDVGGRADIHRLVAEFADAGGVVVFASTELSELIELADEVVVFREGAVVSSGPATGWSEHELLTTMTTASDEETRS